MVCGLVMVCLGFVLGCFEFFFSFSPLLIANSLRLWNVPVPSWVAGVVQIDVTLTLVHSSGGE